MYHTGWVARGPCELMRSTHCWADLEKMAHKCPLPAIGFVDFSTRRRCAYQGIVWKCISIYCSFSCNFAKRFSTRIENRFAELLSETDWFLTKCATKLADWLVVPTVRDTRDFAKQELFLRTGEGAWKLCWVACVSGYPSESEIGYAETHSPNAVSLPNFYAFDRRSVTLFASTQPSTTRLRCHKRLVTVRDKSISTTRVLLC